MPKNKNVLMNVKGVDFHIDDNNYKHFKNLRLRARPVTWGSVL